MADALTLRAANGHISMRHEADLQFNLAFTLVRTGDIHEGLRYAQSVISSLPEAYRANAVQNGRTLLGIVPRSENHRTEVKAYREWVSSIPVSAG